MSVVRTVITGSVFSLLVGAGVGLFLITMPVSLTVALTWGGIAAIGGGAMYGLGAVMGGIDSEADRNESEAEQTEIESKKILNKKLDEAQLNEMLEQTLVKVNAVQAEVHTLREHFEDHRRETDSYHKVTDDILCDLQSRPPILVSSPQQPLDSATTSGLTEIGLFSNSDSANDTFSEQKHRVRGCSNG